MRAEVKDGDSCFSSSRRKFWACLLSIYGIWLLPWQKSRKLPLLRESIIHFKFKILSNTSSCIHMLLKKIFSTHTKTKFMLEKKPKDDHETRVSLSAETVLPSPGPVGALIHIDHDTPGVLMRVNCTLALSSVWAPVSPSHPDTEFSWEQKESAPSNSKI